MLKLSEQEIIKRIEQGDLFECLLEDESLKLKIDDYTPAICAAIHAGHQFNKKLESYCLLTEPERLYEEDPYTCELIDAMPITLVGMDSRYEYDLNRPLATCVYKKAWGKQVWRKALPLSLRNKSVEKHKRFYRILDALVTKIESLFGACVIFDLHTYNHLRHDFETPTFNLGTEQIDMDRWGNAANRFLKQLSNIDLDNVPVTAKSNDIFYGRGYLIAHTNSRFEHTLALPLEIKKVFMNEHTGERYPLVFESLKQGLKSCFVDTAAFFARRHTKKKRARDIDMLSSQFDPAITKIDTALFKIAKGLETLYYVNPINVLAEKNKFLSRHGNYEPQFRYRPLDIDPYLFREKLYRLPVDSIRDPDIHRMYRDVIDMLSNKIDLLVSAGRPGFLYNSLKYYGEPSLDDERNASFLIHATDFEELEERTIPAEELARRFKENAEISGMKCKVEITRRIVAKALVSNSKKTVYINKDVLLNETEANALMHHEVGVHVATTLNAASQSLKVFSVGLPGNTMTQEGLAILNEFQSGNLPLTRLKELALRVLAVKEMLKHNSFRHTYSYLTDEHKMRTDDAFKLAVRVHRSGGFTKDYLYLRGVGIAHKLNQSTDLSNLYVGKTGFNYLPIISEMIDRDMVDKPKFVPEFLANPTPSSSILSFLVDSIKSPSQEQPEGNINDVFDRSA